MSDHHHADNPATAMHPTALGQHAIALGQHATTLAQYSPTLGQRALSTLAKKLHPQLPLTPRESQQLLNLLTTSFRTHLDREHPVHATHNPRAPFTRANYALPSQNISSAASASRHMDTVLNHPLLALKPSRRSSESAASQLLTDPLSWFVNEIATANATLSQAAMVLDVLDTLDKQTPSQTSQLHTGRTAGAVIGDWLQSSGLDASSDFLDMCFVKSNVKKPSTFLSRLVPVLMADGKEQLLWKWFSNPSSHGLKPAHVFSFKQQLLRRMVAVEAQQGLHQAIALFTKACHMIDEHPDKPWGQLGPAGQYLVQAIMSKSTAAVDHSLYNVFRRSVRLWAPSKWAQAVDSMLCLHHPDKPSARPALQFIQNPTGAATYAAAKPAQRRYIVHISLALARQLLEEERYEDAHSVMAFAKQYFSDLVLDLPTQQKQTVNPQSSNTRKPTSHEETNLELLNRLCLT